MNLYPRTAEAEASVTLAVGLVIIPLALAKFLGARLPLPQIAWARYVFHIALLLAPVTLYPRREPDLGLTS